MGQDGLGVQLGRQFVFGRTEIVHLLESLYTGDKLGSFRV
jgi:hypothetical protein